MLVTQALTVRFKKKNKFLVVSVVSMLLLSLSELAAVMFRQPDLFSVYVN